MKTLLFLMIFSSLNATNDFSLAGITRAMNTGDADALGAFFDNSIELSVLDQEDIYSKAQAIQMLKDFFAKHQPKSFSQLHHGSAPTNDSQYCIGNLVTSDMTYRVYIYMKMSGEKTVIQEIRFDKE
ncbi:MAG: DUF4783 domain-containing protein [Saprospiraceae bacterium]